MMQKPAQLARLLPSFIFGHSMRHPIALLLFLATSAVAPAQITIGPEDMPERGDTIRYYTSSGQGLDLTLTGAGVVWDFSALPIGNAGADTLLPVSSAPQFYQFLFSNTLLFPQNAANYGIKGAGFGIAGFQLDEFYDFYKTTNSGFRNVGFGATLQNVPLPTRRVPVDIIHRFPMEFGNVDTSLSKFNVSVPTLLYFGQDQVRASEVDGHGTLILPGKSFEVLRQKAVISRSDTIFIEQLGNGFRFPEPETVEYRWLSTDVKGPVLTVTTVGGNITSVRFFYSPPPPVPVAPPLVIFPNPTANDISVTLPEGYDGLFMIIDAAGREMRPAMIAQPGTIHRFRLDELASGAYTLQLVGGPIPWSARFVLRR